MRSSKLLARNATLRRARSGAGELVLERLVRLLLEHRLAVLLAVAVVFVVV